MATKKIKNHGESVRDLFREILKGITLKDVSIIDEMTLPERKEFCKFCFTVSESRFLRQLVKNMVLAQVEHSVNRAENYEEVTFGRATVNGISLMEELFIKYGKEYQDKYLKDTEPFDKSKSFESVS